MADKQLEEEREVVIELLAGHYAEDRLELDEYERRVELAEEAGSEQELRGLILDLEPRQEESAEAPVGAGDALARRDGGTVEKVATSTALVPASAVPEQSTKMAIFGGPQRKGDWSVPRRLDAVAVFGGAVLDLREARLAHGVTEIRCKCLFGSVLIIVPPELRVDVEGNGILGAFEDHSDQTLYEKMSTCSVRVTGVAVMGGVTIEERLPGETSRQARKRFKMACKNKALAQRERLE